MKRLEYMMMPRLLALSEIAWVEPSAKPNIDDFYKALIPQFKRLDAMNINYRIPDLEGFYNTNAFVDEATLNIKCPLPDAEVRYTTDGKFPTKASQLYEGPLKVTETTEFTLRTAIIRKQSQCIYSIDRNLQVPFQYQSDISFHSLRDRHRFNHICTLHRGSINISTFLSLKIMPYNIQPVS